MALPSITLNGRAVAPLELRFTPAGKAVASLRVAASERRKNPTTQEYEDGERVFLNVTLWEQDAEAAAEAGIEQGDPVLVTGSLFEREYDRNDGTKGKSLEVKYATVAKIPPRQRQQSQGYGAPQGGGFSTPPVTQQDPWGQQAGQNAAWNAPAVDGPPPF